jgi:fructose-1,6-bisphosphatase/inositol monophosphatase family enzyme
MTNDAASDFDYVKAAVLEAGRLALGYYGCAAVTVKPDRSLVTEADVAVQQLLRRRLEERFSGDGLVGEEDSLRKAPAAGSRTWVLDPIDGTAAFSSGLPVWGLSVGIVDGGRPAGGLFLMPATGDLFEMAPGGPVLRNGRPTHLKAAGPFHPESSIMIGPRFPQRRRVDPKFPGKFRSMGSTVAHMCWVAAGSADAAVVEEAYAWDVAVGMAMVRANGGVVRYADGRDVDLVELLGGAKIPAPVLVGREATVAALKEGVGNLLRENAGTPHCRGRGEGS